MYVKLRMWLTALLVLVTSGAVIVAAPTPAHADPSCNNSGHYVLWARGSNETLNDIHAHTFYWAVVGSSSSPGSIGPSAGISSLGDFRNFMWVRVATVV